MRAVGIALALIVGGCGSSTAPPGPEQGGQGGDGGQGGTQPECFGSVHCDDQNACTTDTCVWDHCDNEALDDAAPEGADDDDLGDCIVPWCVAGELSSKPMAGLPCPVDTSLEGVCDDGGQCSCAPPSPDMPHYVDPVNGVDDTQHGGARGGCAYKSLNYALTQAHSDIVLAPATYAAHTGETLPILLRHNQRLICEEIGGQRAKLTGFGAHLTYSVVIATQGTRNGVLGCDVVGTGDPVYCIETGGSAIGDDEIELLDNDISGCLNGIRTVANGQLIKGNTIHDNSLSGVFANLAQSSTLSDNEFFGNGLDIRCNDGYPWPSLTGDGNSGEQGAPTCEYCTGCPFL